MKCAWNWNLNLNPGKELDSTCLRNLYKLWNWLVCRSYCTLSVTPLYIGRFSTGIICRHGPNMGVSKTLLMLGWRGLYWQWFNAMRDHGMQKAIFVKLQFLKDSMYSCCRYYFMRSIVRYMLIFSVTVCENLSLSVIK